MADESQPYAVLNYGIIVFANDAFAQRLGVANGADLESMLILDFVPKTDQNKVRDYLDQAIQTDKNDHSHREKATFNHTGGHSVEAQLQACKTRYEGEIAVELQLLTSEDQTLVKRARRLPWHMYFSFICLSAILTIPNLLLPNLNINNTPSTFLPPDAPSVVFTNETRQIFPDDEAIILLFEGVALFSDGFINAYDQLTDSLSEHPLIDDVISLTQQDHISGSDDGFLVDPLINIEKLDSYHPADRLHRATSDRFAKNTLVSADGSAVALVIIPLPLDDSIRHLALEEEILSLIKTHRLEGYLSAMAGEITTDVAQTRMILADNAKFIPITVGIGLFLIWWLFHRLLAVVVTGVVTSAIVSSTIAFYVIFQQPFNSISGIIPPLLSALTIATLVHFFNALHYASKRGLVGKSRVAMAINEIRRPALFSSLTTSAGLASLALSPIPPIKVFGLASAAGVFLIYLVVIHLLPPIFSKFDNKDWPTRRSGMALMDKFVSIFYQFAIRKPLIVIAITLGLLLWAAPNILKVDAETNVQKFFPESHELRRATNYIDNKMSGTMGLEIIFNTENEEIIQPDTLKFMRQLQTWLLEQEEVDNTISVADFVEEMNWGFHSENADFRTIPDNPELIKQYLFIYDGEDLFDYIDEEYQIARMTLSLNVHGANEIGPLLERIKIHLDDSLPKNMSFDFAGYGKMFSDQEDLMVDGQVYSLIGAVTLILTLMIILWRSLKSALICMIPNLSPIILIFIFMGIFGIYLDMATAMIASVAVGIAIDDTIHIYHGFIYRVKKGVSPTFALARTYRQAGRAVVITTVILCSQFLIMLASAFVPMNSFGLLCSVGLMAALMFDLLLLPAILILLFNKRANIKSPAQ